MDRHRKGARGHFKTLQPLRQNHRKRALRVGRSEAKNADKSSLTSSSPSVKATDEEGDEEQQLLPQVEQADDVDHLNPAGGGGNSV